MHPWTLCYVHNITSVSLVTEMETRCMLWASKVGSQVYSIPASYLESHGVNSQPENQHFSLIFHGFP
jgi:hypothetical protein